MSFITVGVRIVVLWEEGNWPYPKKMNNMKKRNDFPFKYSTYKFDVETCLMGMDYPGANASALTSMQSVSKLPINDSIQWVWICNL